MFAFEASLRAIKLISRTGPTQAGRPGHNQFRDNRRYTGTRDLLRLPHLRLIAVLERTLIYLSVCISPTVFPFSFMLCHTGSEILQTCSSYLSLRYLAVALAPSRASSLFPLHSPSLLRVTQSRPPTIKMLQSHICPAINCHLPTTNADKTLNNGSGKLIGIRDTELLIRMEICVSDPAIFSSLYWHALVTSWPATEYRGVPFST